MDHAPTQTVGIVLRGSIAILLLRVIANACVCQGADDILLLVDDVPPHGVVVADVDLTDAAKWCGVTPVTPSQIKAWQLPDATSVPVQFVPAADFDSKRRVAGSVILKLTAGGPYRLRLGFFESGPNSATTPAESRFHGIVSTDFVQAVHDPAKMGGLPSRIRFVASGKAFERFHWNDRVHDRTLGSFGLAHDPQPRVQRVSAGPLATVVRVRARYLRSDGTQPPSRPEATYDWCYLNHFPLVRVTATATQQPGQPGRPGKTWHEAHFLELNFPGNDFPNWAGGEPLGEGAFTGDAGSFHFDRWGALIDGRNAIATLGGGRALFYDHRGGSYLHAHGDRAWQAWSESQQQWSAWLWMGSADKVVEQIRAAGHALPTRAEVTVVVAAVDAEIEAARLRWQDQTVPVRQQTWWHAAGAAQLAAQGRFRESLQTVQGHRPDDWAVLQAGELGMVVVKQDQGISLQSLCDTTTGRQFLSPGGESLFDITLRHVETKEELKLTADRGWQHVRVLADDPAAGVELRWSMPGDERLGLVEVVARATPDAAHHLVGWQLTATSSGNQWALWRVSFPRIALDELGADAKLFVPRAAGQLEEDAWRRRYQFGGRYPSGWTSMQYMAAYAADGAAGLYVATHDPLGSTKEIQAASQPERRAVVLSFDHPVSNMGKPGNRFELPGNAQWQLFRGDWFDAALIYRRWVRAHAKWYPRLTAEGRSDTPPWMRELAVWGLGGGNPKSGLPGLQEFAEQLGLPVGFHWYNWHQIPFDNDYPHYFPADAGFADAVKRLQQRDIYVMPYINGRLWDTHDRGAEDFEFSKLALPAATKDELGQPYLETYGSQETDGKKVELAAMCPSTELWQTTVRRIVQRLMGECGARGVYIDQVAAAKPQLCFDPSHEHPLGGGHWWTESYWQMLRTIRREMPSECILTTECNAEPYLKWFDGYLTWHWQYDGQVPAFPAVYGGAIQMFGRAYREGPTKDVALRMKAGQQLVFGEQIGWIDPGVVREQENFEFLRQLVHLRYRLRRYFYAGQMARPPKLHGEIPSVTADWQWHGVWPVTTPAAMTGAWQLPDEMRTVLLLVNVSDQPVTARLEFAASDYGIEDDRVRLTVLSGDGDEESFDVAGDVGREVTLPPRRAVAWRLQPAENDQAKQ